MSEQDPHAPTNAGPEPTPVVSASEATAEQPAGTAAVGAGAYVPPPPRDPALADPNPEKRVGAAFAGGLVAAMFLKSLAKRKHR